MAELHPWWDSFGEAIPASTVAVGSIPSQMIALISSGGAVGVTFVECRSDAVSGKMAIRIDVETERPQDLANDVRGVEPIAMLFGEPGMQPAVLALRQDFPDTMHQNWTPVGAPCSLCIDDRPWPEANLTFTSADFLRRIQLWLAKAALGSLHEAAQPLDPLFYYNQLSLILPPAALASNTEPVELVGFLRPDNPQVIITHIVEKGSSATIKARSDFVVVTLSAAPQAMARLRHAPNTLNALADELEPLDIDLWSSIRANVTGWAGLGADDLRRVSSRIIFLISFPILDPEGNVAHDLRAFGTVNTAGEVGTALGFLSRNDSEVGSGSSYLPILFPQSEGNAPTLQIEPMDVYLAFDRDRGASVSGQAQADLRQVVIIGAGALGSQVAINCAREGRFQWTLVDNDVLLPHNLARHSLFANDVGAPKALAVAARMQGLLGTPITYCKSDILMPSDEVKPELQEKLAGASLVIDASASVAVSRHISDLPDVSGRRLSVFFNPAGTAVVLLAEGSSRGVTLRDLEAQYHSLIQRGPELAGHLQVKGPGVRYSGSCRAMTNRISASQSALLSAIATKGITQAIDEDEAFIRIWTVSNSSEVSLCEQRASPVRHTVLGDWTITVDDFVRAELSAMRTAQLPHETGGVLLGITDVSRRSVHVVCALPQPSDSVGSVTQFERGVTGLASAIELAVGASLQQLRYVGEWHSHPVGSSTQPSKIDLSQLCWLTEELESEGLPALMGIVGDDGVFTILLGRSVGSSATLVQARE
jgi:integrative and conjugative element protein (TIGR02256 family)